MNKTIAPVDSTSSRRRSPHRCAARPHRRRSRRHGDNDSAIRRCARGPRHPPRRPGASPAEDSSTERRPASGPSVVTRFARVRRFGLSALGPSRQSSVFRRTTSGFGGRPMQRPGRRHASRGRLSGLRSPCEPAAHCARRPGAGPAPGTAPRRYTQFLLDEGVTSMEECVHALPESREEQPCYRSPHISLCKKEKRNTQPGEIRLSPFSFGRDRAPTYTRRSTFSISGCSRAASPRSRARASTHVASSSRAWNWRMLAAGPTPAPTPCRSVGGLLA
ncbi:hypothetical protein SAMN02745121_05855 [Nannocystis exedens]|uniref:Uncharacterized protein n=1 Tax=Nannocystis exedens TaxID=54 RepID=A0A1I2E1N9_9BACT|nr:hypothetical protein NAEX_02232 [Nannocystis exedens]SFE86488.1 hypothetical protein SAMN02745121_05855 [Nannocystis exedens]